MTINLGGYTLSVRAVSKNTVELAVWMTGVSLFKKNVDVSVARKIEQAIANAATEAEKMT